VFWRIFKRLLWASRGRLALALVAVASGATVCAALVNLDLDAGEKLTREFRSLGANVVIAPPQVSDAVPDMDAAVADRIAALGMPEIAGAAPYLYVAAQAVTSSQHLPVIVAGTWLDEAARMNSYWRVAGQWTTARDDRTHCMVGQSAARALVLQPGSSITLRYAGREISLTVDGVVTSGGSEDSQIFASLATVQDLASLPGRAGLVQVSVHGSSPQIEGAVAKLAAAFPGLEVRPVRQLAAEEGQLLDRIRGLLFATVLLILVLAGLGVLAAMAGLAIERRRDVGLMKALGGPVRRVMRFFIAEATTIGVVGGLIGCGAGMLLAEWIGQRVFAANVSPRLVVVPITVGLMIAVSLAGAFPLRLLGRVRPAEILRGE